MALEDYAYDGVSARDVLDINNETILTKLAREALPPLAWLGETLDKPGRAVRGLLAGQPGELLNLIPFSDTLGITDPANTVTGRDLLRKAGIAGQEDTWGNFLGGLALEVALDPTNFVTLGTKSSLSALGRDALKEGGTGLAKTAAERIAAKQSGLMGLRTPWYTDIMGLPSGNMLLGTGAKAEYLAGQGLTDARNFIDKFAAGRAVTGAFDKANAIRQTLFTPGAGYSMDPRITGTSARVANETEDAVRAATLAQRMEITDQARVAHEYLASHGVPPQVAEDAIGRAVTFRAEVADPRYYQPKDVLKEFLHSDEGVRYADALAAKAPTGYGAAGQVAESLHKTSDEIIRGFDDLVKPIAENRTIFDQLYDLQTQAGVKINEYGSDYGNQYVARQSQASGGARKPQTKARTLPQNVLPGGGVQLDDLVNDKRIAGIATAPIPDGVSRQLHMENVKNTIKQVADEIEQNALKARNLKYGEPVPTPMQAQPVPTVEAEVLNKSVRAKQASGAIEHMAEAPKFSTDDFLEAIKGKPLTSPDTIKALAEHMPHLSDEASTGLLTQLYTELELAGPKRLRKIADAIGAKGADPILGESASDNIIMKLMEAKQPTATPVAPVTAPPVKPAEVVKPSLDIPEPQYPKDLTDAAIKRDSNKLAKFLAKLPQEQVEQGRGFYRNDVIGGMTQYSDNAATMAGRGKAALTVLAEQVVPEKVVKQNPGNYVNLADALKETGLTGIKKESTVAGDVYHAGGKVTLVDLLSEKGITSLRSNGQPMFAEHVNDVLKNQYVPKDLVEKLAVDIKGPGYMQASGARQFIDDATSTIRSWLTLPWIPFHTRNMLEGFTQQGITGGLGKESVADAAMYLAGAVKDTAKKAELDKLANEAFNLKAAFRHQATEMIGSSVLGKEAKTLKPWVTQGDGTIMGATREWLEGFKPANAAKRGEKYATLNPEKSVIIQQAAKVSQAGDDLQRFSQYIGLRRQGMAPDVAAKMVTDAHLDYTKLTPFERDIARPLIPFYCVPVSHEILTQNGWKRYDELTIGEMVMGYDHSTGDMEWVPLEDIHTYDYDGQLFSIKRRGGLDFQFTDDHSWPVIQKGGKVTHSYGSYVYPDRRMFVKARDLNANHYIPRTGHYRFPRESIISPRIAAILGWVVTDGYYRWRGKHLEMMVYQSPGKHLKAIVNLLGTKPRKPHPDTGVVCVPVAHADVNEIKKVFKSKEDLAGIVTRLSEEAFMSMWKAMMDAEGTITGNNIETFCQSTTANMPVCDAFQIMALITGRNMAIRKDTSHYITTTKYLKPIRECANGSMERVVYTGKIWCPTTKYGTWLMRHNGHVIITGNSFSRRNIERMAGQMSNPGPLSSLARAVTSSSEYVPGFVGAGVFPIPGGEDGKQRYMSGFSMPFEDELFSSLVSLASGNLRDAARRGAQTLNPLAKLPITLATNTDLYSGRSLDDMKPTGLASLFPGTSGNVVSQMVSATPLGRLANTVNSVASGRDQNILLKMLTGIRTTDVDSELALQDAAKAGLAKVIKRTGMVSASESLYPRQEYRGENEPESLKALLDSMQQLNKRGQDMRRGRAVTP